MSVSDRIALLGLDWGTTAARAYALGPTGAVLGERVAALGIQQVVPGGFAAALATVLGDWITLDVPRLACGMIGSRQGWTEAPYCACPVALDALAERLVSTPAASCPLCPG